MRENGFSWHTEMKNLFSMATEMKFNNFCLRIEIEVKRTISWDDHDTASVSVAYDASSTYPPSNYCKYPINPTNHTLNSLVIAI
jgi:hypothetical protein